MLRPTDIRDAVEQVLRRGENYVTAYQILERLPSPVRDQLLSERGGIGQGGGQPYTAISVVTQAARLLNDAGICESIYIEGANVQFEVRGELVRAGNVACAAYRIKR